MKTIRLALTDNKDFRLVNVEMPQKPSHNYDIAVWTEEIKRLVDSCPLVSDQKLALEILSFHYSGESFRAQGFEPYKIYSISGWEAKIGYDLIPDDSRWGVTLGDPIATLSKVESEEKEEPNSAHSYTEGYEVTDPFGGLQPTQVKDVFSREELNEEVRKAVKEKNEEIARLKQELEYRNKSKEVPF